MKCNFVLLLALSFVLLFNSSLYCTTFNGAEYVQDSGGQWYEVCSGDSFKVVDTRLIVTFLSGYTQQNIEEINDSLKGVTICRLRDDWDVYFIKSNDPVPPDPLDFCQSYLDCTAVVLECFNVTEVHEDAIPNESEEGCYYDSQIFLQDDEAPDDDINIEAAWEYTTGNPDVKIGIIERGFLWQHPDIGGNFWQNAGEDISSVMEFLFLMMNMNGQVE